MTRNTIHCILLRVTILAACFFFLSPMWAQVAVSPRRITSVVSNTDRVPLSGSLARNLKLASDLGAANVSLMARHVVVVLGRAPNQQATLDQYLSDVQNSHSTQYHQWLTPAEYGARFGAAPDDVQTIVGWLQSQGLTIEKISPAGNTISFAGTVGQLQSAFSTPIHSLLVNGEKHIANTRDPQIPRALAPVVKGIVGLDDFRPKSHILEGPKAKLNPKSHRIEPDLTLFDSAGNSYLYADPSDAATIYNAPNTLLNPHYSGTSYDGTGVTVGIVGDSDVDLSAVANYRLAFLGETAGNVNLPTPVIDGPDPGTNDDQQEAWLDLEVLGGLAPKAKINYYESGDSDLSSGLFNAIERAINDNAVSILSISYGNCEANLGLGANQFLNEIYQQAAAQGITVVVSTGDSGSAGCDSDQAQSAVNGLAVSGLASTPYNVAVGGTDYDTLVTNFNTYVNSTDSGTPPYYRTVLQYIPENPWNNSTSSNGALADNSPAYIQQGQFSSTDIIGGGGGKSTVYTKPAFQNALTPADGVRDLPDVALLSGNGLYGALWVVCEVGLVGPDCATSNGALTPTATFSGAGGTSASTPAFAAMLSLVVQATGSRLGQANNVLYNLATNKYSTVFHDVTMGNNSMVCSSGPDCDANGFLTGYDAGTGYDLASGLGSVDAAAMLANWSSGVGTGSSTTLLINGSSSSVSVTHGTSLNLAVTVNPSSATGYAALVNNDASAIGAPTLHGQPFTIPISSGAGAASYNGLPGGQYSVYANYGGDTSTAASQSQPISVNIAPEDSSTQLTVNAYDLASQPIASLNAIPYGSFIIVDTSVYGTAEGYNASLGAATGTMTILDNGTKIGTAPIVSANLASFPSGLSSIYPFTTGVHHVTATFPGDESYNSNTSNGVSITVSQGGTTLQVAPASASLLSNATDNITINVSTTSLAAAPTGTLTLTANGNTLGATSSIVPNIAFDGTALGIASISILGTALQPGANTITVTYSGDNNYAGSVGTATITVTEVSFTLKTTPLTVSSGAVTGNTSVISVSPGGGFAGLVNLSCAVTSSPANATSPVTCSVPPAVDLTGLGLATTLLTINSTATTTGGTYTVSISGQDAATGKITASTSTQVIVNPVPGITLSSSGGITISAGAASGNTSTVTVTPSNGFTGVVSMSCAVTSMPPAANDPVSCGFSPAVVTIAGTSAGTAVLTVGSTATTTSALHARPGSSRSVSGVLVAMGVFLLLPFRRRVRFARIAALMLLVSLGAAIGCSGGNTNASAKTTTHPGTSAGTYVVTVTANPAGGSTQTTSIMITVN